MSQSSSPPSYLDNALISAGLLDDARETIRRMNSLMEKAMG